MQKEGKIHKSSNIYGMEAAQAGQVIKLEKSIDIIKVALEHHDIKLIYLGKHQFSLQHYSIPRFPANYFSPEAGWPQQCQTDTRC